MKNIRFWRSAKRKGNHIEISVIQADRNSDTDVIVKEFRKAIDRINHLSESEYSYDLRIDTNQNNHQ